LRLLLVCRGHPFATQAGTEIFVGNLASELAKQSHEVHIIYGVEKICKENPHVAIKNLTTHPFHLISTSYIRALDFRRKSANLSVTLINKLDIDAVIAFGAGTFPSYIFNRIKKLRRRPLLVYYAMDSMKMEYERSKMSSESKNFIMRLKMWVWYSNLIRSDRNSCISSDMVLASSNDTISHLIADYSVPRNKVKLLYGGIPDDFTNGIETVDPDTPTFLHIAGGVRKGTNYFLEAMKLLGEKYGLRAKAVIARATPTQINQVKRLGIDAEVYGYLSILELKRLYASCTAFVSPSLSEGFCLPVVEAAMFGKPAIVSSTGSLPELVVDGENGFVVPVADVAPLAEAMYRIAVNEQLRKRMGEKAKQLSQRFKISNTVKTLIELLDNKLQYKMNT
jgi:glycosyltransferase involved in cell wall biosynthesis